MAMMSVALHQAPFAGSVSEAHAVIQGAAQGAETMPITADPVQRVPSAGSAPAILCPW